MRELARAASKLRGGPQSDIAGWPPNPYRPPLEPPARGVRRALVGGRAGGAEFFDHVAYANSRMDSATLSAQAAVRPWALHGYG